MRIAVLGSGEFVAEIARLIYDSGVHTLAAIGYAPETEAKSASLIALAEQAAVPTITRPSQLDDISADLVYLHSYPTLIPEEILSRHRILNVHYAPLPRYRGFHGLVWSIINGESQLGYTIHEVAAGIDNGPIYYQHLFSIDEHVTIIDALSHIENHMRENILSVFDHIAHGIAPIPQDESKAIYVTRRKPEDGRIDWNAPSARIHNTIRALTPPYTPGAFTTYKDENLYLCKSRLTSSPAYFHTVGKVVNVIPGQGVWVKSGDSVVEVNEVLYRGTSCRADKLLSRVGITLGTNSHARVYSRTKQLDPVIS